MGAVGREAVTIPNTAVQNAAVVNAAIPNVTVLYIVTFVECRVFRGTPPRHGAAFWWFHANTLYVVKICTICEKLWG